MAVQAVNSNQAPNPPQEVRAPQAPPQEVERPREEDRVNLSTEAQQKARVDAARQDEARRAQEAQQQAVVQARQDASQTRAAQERTRVDVTA